MVASLSKFLNQIASFLKVQGGKISTGEDCLPTRVSSKHTSYGHLNIIYQLLKEANSNLNCSDVLEQAEVRQWIEYTLVYASQTDCASNAHQVLKELNVFLSTRTYLVGHKLTIADIFLYYALQNAMESLTLLDKEKYLNVSRWFDNLQQNASLRQSNNIVDFSTTYLVGVAPARH